MARADTWRIGRLSVSVLLAGVAVVLFLLNQGSDTRASRDLQNDFVRSVTAIDKEVDRILSRFGIQESWIRRKEISDPRGMFTRIERRVRVPLDVVPAVMNREFNALAHKYDGRAVASEDLKENSVTIHIILQRSVIQTVILKIDPDIQRKETSGQFRKV